MDRLAADALYELSQLETALRAELGADAVLSQQPLARHTSLQIGGPADLLVVADNLEILRRSIALARLHGVPWRVLGSGCNILVSDAGLRGIAVLNRARKASFSSQPEGQRVRAESGTVLATLARQCVARGWAGLEWAVGIPGTVGGAVVGNAGAWGSNIAAVLTAADVLEPDGSESRWRVEQFDFQYRSSAIKRARQESKPAQEAVILEAEFGLRAGDRQELQARVAEITARRKASQPVGATCGSVFKNPPGDYAGRLIEAAGLKGCRMGGAQISTQHANFVLNRDRATAGDILALVQVARDEVATRFGVILELEIELVGEWPDVLGFETIILKD